MSTDYSSIILHSNKRVLCLLCLSYIFGCFLTINSSFFDTFSLSFITIYSIIFSCVVLGVLLLSYNFIKNSNYFFLPKEDIFIIILVVILFSSGVLRVFAFNKSISSPFEAFYGKTTNYTAIIYDEISESNSGKSYCIPVMITQGKNDDTTQDIQQKIILYTDKNQPYSFEMGTALTFNAILYPPVNKSHSGAFSSRDYLYKQGYANSIYAKQVYPLNSSIENNNLLYKLNLFGIYGKKAILSSINNSFETSTPQSALLKGILLGYREDFSAEQTNDYAKSGFIHITAVSGMHVMFLVAFLSKFMKRYKYLRKIFIPTLYFVLFAFAAIVSFSSSITRAIIMLVFMNTAPLFNREPDSVSSIAAAALTLLIINPYYLTDYGFILSFSATLGIVIFSSPILKKFSILNLNIKGTKGAKLYSYTAQSIATSLGGNIGIGYFVARFFNRISFGGIIGSIPITILSSYIFIGGIINCLLALICKELSIFIAKVFISPALWLTNSLAHFFANDLFNIFLPSPTYSFFLLYIIILMFLWYFLKPNKTQEKHKMSGTD